MQAKHETVKNSADTIASIVHSARDFLLFGIRLLIKKLNENSAGKEKTLLA